MHSKHHGPMADNESARMDLLRQLEQVRKVSRKLGTAYHGPMFSLQRF